MWKDNDDLKNTLFSFQVELRGNVEGSDGTDPLQGFQTKKRPLSKHQILGTVKKMCFQNKNGDKHMTVKPFAET